MAQYSRTVLTDAGVILARRIMDDETLTMEFTRIQTGSGEYSSGEDIASRTSLKAPKQSFPISSRSVTSEQVLHLKYVVSNVNPDSSPLTVGYYVRELAIYAQVSGEAEILYAIAIADADSADYLPEYDELQPTTITMDWFLPVGNAEQINVYASPDAYALAEDLEALALVVDEKLDAYGDSAGNTVTFTSSDVPDSTVTKDTGWTTSGALSSGETHESFLTKISRMIKNIRWLYKLIGTTDISSIGNGTITGGLSSLNDSFVTTNNRFTNVAHRSMPNGISGVPWSGGFRFAVVYVYFGRNTAVSVPFVLFPDMLESGTKYLVSGSYKNNTDNHYVRISYNTTGVYLAEWWYGGTDIASSNPCPLHVYEWF